MFPFQWQFRGDFRWSDPISINPWPWPRAFTGAKTRKAIGTKGPTTASSSSAASNASRKPAAFASEKKSAGRCPRTKREKHADLPEKSWNINEFVEKSMKIKWICILLLKLMSIYNAFITNMGELDNSFKICKRTTYIGIYRANIFV